MHSNSETVVHHKSRGNGVTIMLNKQVMVTQEPIEADNQLISQTLQLHQQWIKDGKPESNQGY